MPKENKSIFEIQGNLFFLSVKTTADKINSNAKATLRLFYNYYCVFQNPKSSAVATLQKKAACCLTK